MIHYSLSLTENCEHADSNFTVSSKEMKFWNIIAFCEHLYGYIMIYKINAGSMVEYDFVK